MNKIELKAKIQTEFENKPNSAIATAIKIYKIIKFLNTESTIFIMSLIPFVTIATLGVMYENFVTVVGTVAAHYPFYKYIVKGVIYRDSEVEYEICEDMIEILTDIGDMRKK